MRKFFYIRVSSKNQSIERKIITVAEISIPEEYFFIERTSRKDIKRPEYQLMNRRRCFIYSIIRSFEKK